MELLELAAGRSTRVSISDLFSHVVSPVLTVYDSSRFTYNSRCTCGNCNVEMLQNPRECQCCREIPKCVEALSSELVLREVVTPPECIIQHPGFRSVCIDRWSLRQAAGKYRTMERKKYKQTGLEET